MLFILFFLQEALSKSKIKSPFEDDADLDILEDDYHINEDGVLTIFCQEEMDDYNTNQLPPWQKENDKITHLKFSGNCTIIGSYSFYGLTNLQTIEFIPSIETIGENSFYGCEKLDNIQLPDNLETIQSYAFTLCTSLKSIHFPDSLKTI